MKRGVKWGIAAKTSGDFSAELLDSLAWNCGEQAYLVIAAVAIRSLLRSLLRNFLRSILGNGLLWCLMLLLLLWLSS